MKPAIKTKSGKVVTAAKPGMKHKEIPAEGKRGFTLDNGKFADRKTAAKVAKIPGVKSLHSEDLPAYKRKRGK